MGPKAPLYLRELNKKYGDVFAVRERMENFYGKDLGDNFEKYVIDYYETEFQKVKEEDNLTDKDEKREVGPLFDFMILLIPFTLFLIPYLLYRKWWLLPWRLSSSF